MMKHSKLLYFSLILCSLAISACKDDDDKQSLKFQGRMVIDGDIPSYVNPGDALTLSTHGLKPNAKDDSNPHIFYSYLVSPLMTKRDTSEQFKYTFPDTLCTTILSVYGSSIGYTSASTEYEIVIVKPGESVTGIEFDPEGGTFTDKRDSRLYHYTSIAGTDWMSQNMAYCGCGKAFKSTKESGYDAMTDIFGMYYSWNEAQKVCPEGWRLPTEGDWAALCNSLTDVVPEPYSTYKGISGKFMANARLNGERLWAYFPNTKIEPEATYINLLPTGFANISGGDYLFDNTQSYAAFWLADESGAEKAWCRYTANNSDSADIIATALYKSDVAMPVRCVRDSE